MAVGSFIVGSLLEYQYCQIKRHQEREGMRRAIEIMDRKKAEKKLLAEKKKKRRNWQERRRNARRKRRRGGVGGRFGDNVVRGD